MSIAEPHLHVLLHGSQSFGRICVHNPPKKQLSGSRKASNYLSGNPFFVAALLHDLLAATLPRMET
jgi:hypothetical protein